MTALDFAMAGRSAGDVDARVWVRIEEVRSSIALIRQLLRELKPGPVLVGHAGAACRRRPAPWSRVFAATYSLQFD